MMIFGDKNVINSEKSFTAADLYQYAEQIIRERRLQERRCEDQYNGNYAWLKSRNLQTSAVDNDLEELRPLINKMTPESCAVIAVKLDDLSEERNITTHLILTNFKRLLQERDSKQMLDKHIKVAKETKRSNKVQPDLEGREPTVSFVVDSRVQGAFETK